MNHIRPCLALVSLVALAGCFGTTASDEYFYQVTHPLEKDANKAQKTVAVAVGDFRADPGYQTQRMVYRSSTAELQYYGYRRWVSEPSKVLATAFLRHMQAAQQFGVAAERSARRAPLLLLGTVHAIEEIDDPDDSSKTEARLAMTLTVRDNDARRVVLRHSFNKRMPCSRRHPSEVASAISKIVQVEARNITNQISELLRKGK